jgi:hypothetical protein
MNLAKTRRMQFKVSWRDASEGDRCTTLAAIAVHIDDIPVWPVTGDDTDEFEWYADELLSHLTECWKPLILRQNYPIDVQPERPAFLMAEAARRWSALPDSLVQNEEKELFAFEDVHNLANAFGGVTGLLPLWFLRDRDQMIIDTQERLSEVPIQAAIEALTAVGQKIADRLQRADQQRWSRLVKAWQCRDRGDGAVLLAFTIGRDKSTATALIEQQVLQAPKSFADAVNDNDELRIAARMAGPLPIHQIKTVIDAVRTCHPRSAPNLDAMVSAAHEFIASQLGDARPHVQGYEIAKWLRGRLNISPALKIDPIDIIQRRCGIDVRLIDFHIQSLDAIAVWGSKHGPAVLLNKDSARLRTQVQNIWHHSALRITAAHELCHLLVDGEHALTAVDILHGRMPPRIEQRARAFAAELLIPKEEAATFWEGTGYPLEFAGVDKVVKALCRKFGVTASVAAWQLENGVNPSYRELLTQVLERVVPQR